MIEDEELKDLQNFPLDINKLENLIQLQLNDPFCKNIMKQLNKNKLIERQPYLIQDYILHRIIKEQNHQYETVVIPRDLIPQVLHAAHEFVRTQWHRKNLCY